MSEATQEQDIVEPIKAEGIDDEPVESNRRLFTGRFGLFVASYAAIYVMFHIIALNGVSISAMTGITIPFLPNLPLETWNFRIIHIAGALGLGFLLFSATQFSEDGKSSRLFNLLSIPLSAAALLSLASALYFQFQISNGKLWNGLDPEIKFNETWLYGAPLLIATFGAVILSWFDKKSKGSLSGLDVTLAVSGLAVAAIKRKIKKKKKNKKKTIKRKK